MMTQGACALVCQCNIRTWRRWESGGFLPDASNMKTIIKMFPSLTLLVKANYRKDPTTTKKIFGDEELMS